MENNTDIIKKLEDIINTSGFGTSYEGWLGDDKIYKIKANISSLVFEPEYELALVRINYKREAGNEKYNRLLLIDCKKAKTYEIDGGVTFSYDTNNTKEETICIPKSIKTYGKKVKIEYTKLTRIYGLIGRLFRIPRSIDKEHKTREVELQN